MRIHNVRSCGGRRCSQPAQAANQSNSLAFQVMRPSSSSPPHRPYPYHAFQNYHFRFQSSLIRPIISANISIIFSEEESPPVVSAYTVAESSKGGFRIASSHGIKRQQEEDGQANTESDL